MICGKSAYKEAEEELKKNLIQPPNSPTSQENNQISEVILDGGLLAPKNHTYPLFVMRIAIESVINVLTGFRGGCRNLELISQVIADSIGRQRFQEKLGWVSDYKKEIIMYSQMMDIVKIASEQIKHEGLHEYSIDYFKDSTIVHCR